MGCARPDEQEIAEVEDKIRKRIENLQKLILRYMNTVGKLPDFIAGPTLETLPMAAVEKTKVYPDRRALLNDLPRGGRVAEIGTLLGDWAETILTVAEPRDLYIFDKNIWRIRPEVAQESRVTLYEGDSSRRLADCPDASFDWIYIDGDHSYDGVKRDIAQAVLKIKLDGLLVFNDYNV